MKSRWVGLVAAAIVSVAPMTARADAVLCLGTINAIGMHSNGALLMSYGSTAVHTICNLNAAYGGMEKDTCRAWFATIQAAKAQQRTIRLYYDTTVSGNPASCAAIVYGQNTHPYFMEVLD